MYVNHLKSKELYLNTKTKTINSIEDKINGVKLKNSKDDDSMLILSEPQNAIIKVNRYIGILFIYIIFSLKNIKASKKIIQLDILDENCNNKYIYLYNI